MVDREQDPGQTDAATSWLECILQHVSSVWPWRLSVSGSRVAARMNGNGTTPSQVTPSMRFPTRTRKLAWLHAGGQ